MTRIAVDAMGGDHAPKEIVEGAVWAAHDYGVAIELVGKQDQIENELKRIGQKELIEPDEVAKKILELVNNPLPSGSIIRIDK